MFRKHTEVWLDVLDVVPAEDLAGKTAIEVGERIHAVMEAGIVAREKEQGTACINRPESSFPLYIQHVFLYNMFRQF